MAVTVYSDVDYKGKSATLEPGCHKLDPSMNDSISSVRVPDGWTVTLYDSADFTGASYKLTADTATLANTSLHDKASSIVVQADQKDASLFADGLSGEWFYFEE